MPRSAGLLAFPEFTGFTRKLVLWNLGAYFLLLLLGVTAASSRLVLISWTALIPPYVFHGFIWQLVTYSFVQVGLFNTAFALLSIWFVAGPLESMHGARWTAELYFVSVIGAGLAALALYAVVPSNLAVLTGCWGGIFGLLIAFGVLYGEQQFMMFPLPMMIRAKYLIWVYIIITIALLFSHERVFAFSELGGALFGYLYIKFAPRRGLAALTTGRYFDLRNSYYRWKRRRAAHKFEVYMHKQDRKDEKDPNDRKWMN